MKNQTAGEFSRPANSALIFKSCSASEIATSLLPFYLGLDCDARHQRFGAVTSDEAIAQHCKQLNPDNAIVLACAGPEGIIAAIELHALAYGWADTELALVSRSCADQTTIVAHLLQLAALAAGKRGCTTFVVSPYASEHQFLELLRGLGRVRCHADSLRLELSGMVSVHSRPDGSI
jgi:hypothetical protein